MQNGKGSKQRPTNLKIFRNNYDKIFKKSGEKIAREVRSGANNLTREERKEMQKLGMELINKKNDHSS